MSHYVLKCDDINYVTMIKGEHASMRKHGWGDTIFYSPNFEKAWRMTKRQAEFWHQRNPTMTVLRLPDKSKGPKSSSQRVKT